MEGVICYFKENENNKIRFFFIEGEDGNQYFCHPSNMDPAFFDMAANQWPLWNSFLYDKWRYETHWEEENNIFILSFDSNEGPKGLFATNVKPSNKRLNTETDPFMIQVTDLIWDHIAESRFGEHPNYGAVERRYRSNVYMHYKKINGYGKGQVDIKPYMLEENSRSKISDDLVKRVREKIIGTKIKVKRLRNTDSCIERFSFDTSILKVNM